MGRLAAGILALVLLAPSAFAHGLELFVRADGDVLRGQVYFRGGAEARGVPVVLSGPGGRELARTESGPDGRFTFVTPHAPGQVVTAETADGHRAEFALGAPPDPKEEPGLLNAAVGIVLVFGLFAGAARFVGKRHSA